MKSTCFSKLEFSESYPDENPEGWEEEVARAMGYIGLFDAIDFEHNETGD